MNINNTVLFLLIIFNGCTVPRSIPDIVIDKREIFGHTPHHNCMYLLGEGGHLPIYDKGLFIRKGTIGFYDEDFPLLADSLFLAYCTGKKMYDDVTNIQIFLNVRIHYLPEQVAKCKNLEHLYLKADDETNWSSVFKQLAQHNKKLKKLSLAGSTCTTLTHLPKEIGLLTNLTHLHIECTEVLDEFPKVITKLTNLEEITLRSKTPDAKTFSLLQSLPHLNRMTLTNAVYFKQSDKWKNMNVRIH